MAAIDEVLGFERDVKVDAGAMIEVTRHVSKDKKFECGQGWFAAGLAWSF